MKTLALVVAASCCTVAVAQSPAATVSHFGTGCNGTPLTTIYALNDTAPALQVTSLPNEYAYPVINTSAVAMQVLGFSVFTRSNSGTTTEVGNAGIILDSSGATATAHTTRAVAPISTGIIKVDGTPAWCSVALHPPVIVQPGQAFFLQLDAFSRIAPPMQVAGGASAVAGIYWRRPTLAWAVSGSVFRPIVRVHAVAATPLAPTMTHTGMPVLGQTFTANIHGGIPFTVGYVALGFSDTLIGSQPLPLDLAVFGAPNCLNYTSLDHQFVVLLDAAGSGSFAATVPNSPSIAGMAVFQQGAMVGAPNALGLFVTNAMRLRLGY